MEKREEAGKEEAAAGEVRVVDVVHVPLTPDGGR
jgi:hypothetical protein